MLLLACSALRLKVRLRCLLRRLRHRLACLRFSGSN
jgi:hypothetical protein